MKNKSFYEKLVYVAYAFYILLGFTWFLGSLIFGGFFNFWASSTIIIFAAQAYFRKKLTNLILGVLAFGLSIFWTLQFIWEGSKTGYDGFIKTVLCLSVISIVMSVVLMFSYTKLSFQEQ